MELGKQWTVVGEVPPAPNGPVYTLEGTITRWQAGNVATRMIVGFGSGREAADLTYYVVDAGGRKVMEKKDTIRTNFYAQGTGSTGTLGHPFAQKIADRIKDTPLP